MLCVFDKGMISSRGTFAATETVERVVFLLRQGRLECLARRAKEKKRKEKKRNKRAICCHTCICGNYAACRRVQTALLPDKKHILESATFK